MSIGPSSEQSFIVSRGRRDATVVIRGYVYQVNTTLLRWIELAAGHSLELEAGEDIDVVREALTNGEPDRIFEAVKHRERNLTLRSPEALAAIATFHEHRRANRSLKLRFRYVTNSEVGTENPTITELGTPGIHIWERVRADAIVGKQKRSVISALRSFLLQCSCPSDVADSTWNEFGRYIKKATIPELNRFIAAFEWSTSQSSPDDLEGRVRYELVNCGKVKSGDDAETAFQHLFHFVFALLSQRSEKILTADLLSEQLEKLDQAESGRNVLSRLNGLEDSLFARFDRLEQQLVPMAPELRNISESVARIEQAVTSQHNPRYEESFDHVGNADDEGRTAASSQLAAVRGDTEIGRSLPDILSAAILAQNEELAATVVAQAETQIVALRDAARKGRRSEVLQGIEAQKSNRAAWQVIPSARRAQLMRLEASVLLGAGEEIARVRQILDEAARLAPGEDDSRLRACVALWEHDVSAAMALLEGKDDSESRNLRALFLLLLQRAEESWQALPQLDSDPAIRAETLRIRCLNLLHRRDLGRARVEINEALDAEPEWPSLQYLAATISFYEGMSPAAIPTNTQGWPEPSSCLYVLDKSEALAKFREAFDVFDRWSRSPETSIDEQRLFQMWCLACLAVDPSRRKEASAYAKQALAADHGQYRLVPWILAQRYEDIDLSATEAALMAVHVSGRADVLEIIALVMLLVAKQRGGDAVSVLDRAENLFAKEKNRQSWHHWRAVALVTAGEFDRAKSELAQLEPTEKIDPLWCEIQRLESQKSGDWDAYAAALKNRYLATKGADALLEYCDFEARRKNWTVVANLSSELLLLVGTGDALRLAAIATFNAGRSKECLDLLASRADLVTDNPSGEELHRLSVACNRKLGRLILARQQAEHLSTFAPATANLLVLAQLQLETGESKALALNARRMYQQDDLTSAQALRVANFVQREDSQLAQLLWRRSITKDLPDEAVGAALSLGYHLGLDRELRPLLVRMNELASQGKGGIERKTFNDLIEYVKRHQENLQWCNALYARGEVAIHLIPTSIRAQLVDLYHGNPTYHENVPGAGSSGILAVHGGRPAIIGFPAEVPRWRLNLDLTSLLLAHHVGILPKLEHAFSPLRLPPSTFAALDSMQTAISAAQLSQIETTRHVLQCIEDGKLVVKDDKADAEPDLSSIGGRGWAELYQLSRDSGGFLIDFVPKIGSRGLLWLSRTMPMHES